MMYRVKIQWPAKKPQWGSRIFDGHNAFENAKAYAIEHIDKGFNVQMLKDKRSLV